MRSHDGARKEIRRGRLGVGASLSHSAILRSMFVEEYTIMVDSYSVWW
jgi:hypothetical protein